MDCINFKYPIQAAETQEELNQTIQRMLIQYELNIYQTLYPQADYAQLAEIIEEETDEGVGELVPEVQREIDNVSYWLTLAQTQATLLKALAEEGSLLP